MNKDNLKRFLYVSVLCIFMSGAIAGCSPAMRKKFVREKKKEEDNSFVPVLDPIDYPNQMETSKMQYDYFYALLKVWHKDALMLIDDKYADKQMKYTITQIKIQLEELEKIFDGAAKQKIEDGKKSVDQVLAFFDKPEAFRNRDVIRTYLNRMTDSIVKPLAFENIKDDLKG